MTFLTAYSLRLLGVKLQLKVTAVERYPCMWFKTEKLQWNVILRQIVHFAFISLVLRRSRKELLYNTAYVLRACGKDFYDTLPLHKQCGKVEGEKPKCGHQYVGNAVRPDTKWPEQPGTKWYNAGYERKKASPFEHSEIMQFLNSEETSNFWIMRKCAVAVSYSGGLRGCELCQLACEDISKSSEGYWISYHPDKSRGETRTRKFLVPSDLAQHVGAYLHRLEAFQALNGDLFKTIAKTDALLNKPMGRNMTAKFGVDVVSYLNLPKPESYTGHCFCWAAAKRAADQGANLVQLKRHFNWSGLNVAMWYIDEMSTIPSKWHHSLLEPMMTLIKKRTRKMLQKEGQNNFHQQSSKSMCKKEEVWQSTITTVKMSEDEHCGLNKIAVCSFLICLSIHAFGDWHKWTMWRKKRYMHLVCSILQTRGLCIPHCCPRSSGSKPSGRKDLGFVKCYFTKCTYCTITEDLFSLYRLGASYLATCHYSSWTFQLREVQDE